MEEEHSDGDWEVLESDQLLQQQHSDSIDLVGIEEEGAIRSDYFSLESNNKRTTTVALVEFEEEGSVNSDNPSWIDPSSEGFKAPDDEFWSDSASEGKIGSSFGGDDALREEGFGENEGFEVGVGRIGENEGFEVKSTEFASGDTSSSLVELGENLERTSFNGRGGDNKGVNWWKIPFELLKICVFRVSVPVWSLGVAVAVMGFVILGRRLYKMRRKIRNVPLKVTLEGKKLSQFMTSAARLNEAFSVVKRVPVIRPSIPAPGGTPWPIMGLR
ncbi:hypothetical protein GIB67_014422 [Kingdonia uniflora]|uniref:DUF6821 domain-containing protein n=1 Tax=Kingdonia uniflora TaxID=39325 RepID=A0A7J7LZ28_9MAGN|nr:hypothetical protein GIB67_014422 [Kingdonia uniflora]